MYIRVSPFPFPPVSVAVEGGGEGEGMGGGDADHRDRFRWCLLCLFCENLLRLFLPLFVQLLDLVAAGKLLCMSECMSEWWVSESVGVWWYCR